MGEKVTSLASSIDSMREAFQDHKKNVNSKLTTTTSEMEKELKKMETALSVLEESKEKFGKQLGEEMGELQKDVSVLKIQRSEDVQMIENRLEALEQSEAAQRHEREEMSQMFLEEMSQMFSEIKQELYDYSKKMESVSEQNTWMLEHYKILEHRVESIEKKFLLKKNLQKRWSSVVSIPSQSKEHHHSRKVLPTSPVKARDQKQENRVTKPSSLPTAPFSKTFSPNDGEVLADQQNSLSQVHLRTQNPVKSPKKRFSFWSSSKDSI